MDESISTSKRDKKIPKDDEEDEKKVSSPTEKDEEEEVPVEDAKPIGDFVRVLGKGKTRRNHYKSFEFDGLSYELVSAFSCNNSDSFAFVPCYVV